MPGSTGTPAGGPYEPDVPAPWHENVGVGKERGMMHPANGNRHAGFTFAMQMPGLFA